VKFETFFQKNSQRNKKNLKKNFHGFSLGGVGGGKPVKHVTI